MLLTMIFLTRWSCAAAIMIPDRLSRLLSDLGDVVYFCSWALRNPLVNTNVLVSVLASYAVLLDLTPLAAGK